MIFTDGSTDDDGSNPKIGGVSFMWWNEAPLAFSEPVPDDLVKSLAEDMQKDAESMTDQATVEEKPKE